MLKVVLDTNIYISAINFGGQASEVINLILTNDVQLYISREIITEVMGVLRKKFGFEQAILEEIEDILREICLIVEPSKTLTIIKNHPADNRILECALETKAHYLISGDKKHLLKLKKYQNFQIISAQDFLAIAKKL